MESVSIVTPCYNRKHLIAETVESVLNQRAVRSGRLRLEYIVCDGGSDDGTLEILERYAGRGITLVSEPDRGVYDALAKGLRRTTGDIVTWINAGDYYHPSAFDIVADVMEQHNVHWLTGYNVFYNESAQVTGVVLPFRYRPELFAAGFYGDGLRFVQQESTFWRRDLLDLIDYDRLAGFRLAGDFYLWTHFAKKHDLKIVEAYLGGWRRHGDNLSNDVELYRKEMSMLARRRTLGDHIKARFDQALWVAPPRVKKLLNREGLFRWDSVRKVWA